MKLFPLLCLLALSLVQEGTSTHHETCECNEIRELVNASVQQAAACLEYKLGIMINTAISNINTTDKTALSDLENRLTSTILLTPIQTQLDYITSHHLHNLQQTSYHNLQQISHHHSPKGKLRTTLQHHVRTCMTHSMLRLAITGLGRLGLL